MKNIILGFLQVFIVVAISPFIKTFIHKIKCILRGQKGPSLFQAYKDLYKLFNKEVVISKDASFISRIAPYMVLISTLWAVTFLPVFSKYTLLSFSGDIIALVYILAFGIFFIALYGLDQGSAFGGLGSSREVTIAALAESSLMLIIFTFALQTGSTNIGEIFEKVHEIGLSSVPVSFAFALISLLLVSLAENARIPFDNPETHLELTMVHEAMILETSGRHLALFELSSYIKLAIYLTVASNLFFPIGFYKETSILLLALSIVIFLIKVLLFSIPVALIEMSIAKFRFFRVPEILTLAFILSLISLIVYHV
ncbi:respiratory chain complex I subunit 1 family protein [Sulfurihydrogenibium subterraneum]|uniref:respiratory chain complex I subunit 1 family protein n=1 Tax=Sulfurihydrogenibium subterraneum TaxID=171121 RepID=UPI0004920751|nr:NADH-quinone oxidoreductase subunit H [Sulfurihydrogenibium subterraneum]